MKALKKTVIVEVIEASTTTESGIVLQGAQERNPTACIVSVGPQVDCGVVVGDRVVVDWGRVGKFSHCDRTYYVTDQTNILGVFENS
jgi:co-chaperonin GroES (HSP10)